eukprot:GILJ01004330.1.p1 GENE.GILJ01004330.1~~GILJ01004330.1.p1  ORF type:complete len:647 (+),score=118.97 GILJ01004330.1:2203-4143(+)
MKKIPSVTELSIAAFAESRDQNLDFETEGSGVVPVVIEVPRGSPNKYELHKDTGLLSLDRVLHSSVFYPGDYGYVPHTLCGDGDPIDVIVLSTYKLDPGVVVDVRVVGVMNMIDEKGEDKKLVGVVVKDPRNKKVVDIEDVPNHTKLEIQHFFQTYKELENTESNKKWAKVSGFQNREVAMNDLKQSRAAFLRAREEKKRARASSVSGTASDSPQLVRLGFEDSPSPPDYYHIPLGDMAPEIVPVFIEVPKGYNNKYEFDHHTGYMKLDRVLHSAVFYPGDYGFVPQTLCGDGDPLDVIILTTFPLNPGSLVDVRVIGVLDMEDEKGQDAKVLGVVHTDPRSLEIRDIEDVDSHVKAEIQHFFETYKSLELNKWAKVTAWRNRDAAMREVRETHATYLKNPGHLGSVPKLYRLPIGSAFPRIVNSVIECPKGTSNKYKMSKDLGILKLDRVLHSSMFYPGNYGFIPQTLGEDGKPVDIMLLSFYPLHAGTTVKARVVAVLELEDEKGPDSKIIAVPLDEPRAHEIVSLHTIPRHMKEEVSNFFQHYKDLEDESRWCRIVGWKDTDDAVRMVQGSHERYYLFGLRMERLEEREVAMSHTTDQILQQLTKLEAENTELRNMMTERERAFEQQIKSLTAAVSQLKPSTQ